MMFILFYLISFNMVKLQFDEVCISKFVQGINTFIKLETQMGNESCKEKQSQWESVFALKKCLE